MEKKSRRGFTMIEVLITVAIVVILAIVLFFNLFGAKQSVDISATGQQIVAVAREAQSQAMEQSQGAAWGIHFANPTNTTPFYVIFKGLSYSTSTTQAYYSLPPTVSYATATIPLGSSLNVIFTEIFGTTPTSTTISIQSKQNPSTIENIQINGAGFVTYNFCNGSLGSWQPTTHLPVPIDSQSAVAYNGYAYSIDGLDANNNATSTVLYASIGASGPLGSWQPTTQLPSAVYGNSAVAYDGYLYSIGGSVNFNVTTSTVYYAPINANGTLGSWQITSAYPSAIGNPPAIVYDAYIYSMGGYPSNGIPTSTVYSVRINASGTIGAWQAVTRLPSGLDADPALAYNGYVYPIGGNLFSGLTSTVLYASLCSNGN